MTLQERLTRHLERTPDTARAAFVASNATLVGDVALGADSSVWYGCVLRGDINSIVIGEGSNVQDGTVVHLADDHGVRIGTFTTIGHAAIIHACEVGDECLIGMGATVLDGYRIGSIALENDGPHRVSLSGPDGQHEITARWVVDASGRAGLLKRQLGLRRPSTHGANAAWWRVSSRVRIDDWSGDADWRSRVPSGLRWQSTNHLMGAGYWVWLIPLGSGSTSFGIVADGDMHPFHRINRFERAVDWLREFEPQCAAVVEAHASELEDFLALQHFAHGCSRVFSPERWALVGEAGVFTDPFYSPGSDFIAMGNDYVTDLIVRDARGEEIASRAEAFNTTYLRLFDAFIRLYDGQYPIMGNAQVMTAKVSWDNACYWAITALLYFQRRLRQPEFVESIDPLMRRFFVLHARMQQFFKAWDRADTSVYSHAATSVIHVDFLRRLQAELGDGVIDDEALRRRLTANYALLEKFARTWQAIAVEQAPELARVGPARPSGEEGTMLDVSALRLTMVGVPGI